MLYHPREIASELGIGSSTLRLWSVQFAADLSASARKASGENSTPWAQRRYTEEDLELLLRVKAMLAQGFTYEEAKHRLRHSQATGARKPGRLIPIGELRAVQESSGCSSSEQEALQTKDKTIATLKGSLGFLDAYLQAVRQERDEVRQRVILLEKQLRELQSDGRTTSEPGAGTWWKEILRGL